MGKIVSTFGLKGWVKVQLMTDFAERFDPGSSLLLDGREVEVLDSSWHRNQVRIQLEGIDSIDQAEELRGKYLYAPPSSEPNMEEDEFYSSDLVGLEVRTDTGRVLGSIEEVIPGPAHDVLRVGETLIPAVKQFVLDVSLPERRMTVRLIPGMGPGETPEEA